MYMKYILIYVNIYICIKIQMLMYFCIYSNIDVCIYFYFEILNYQFYAFVTHFDSSGDDDDVYLDKFQARGVEKSILYT
jgi:hypothetical protein